MRGKLCMLMMVCLWGGCDPFHTGFEDEQPARLFESRQKAPTTPELTQLKVLSWNVKFGAARVDVFFDCHGDGVLLSEQEVYKNLDALVAKINEINPHVLLLQEIDIKSKRVAYIDQVRYILDRTRLNYAAYASQWKGDYIPTDGIGNVDSGNAILSRYPFLEAERLALPLSEDQDALTRYFYLQRNILKTKLDLGQGRSVWVLNIHADAFGQDGTKKKHIDRFKAELDKLEAAGESFVAGGDLNALPPGSAQVKDFEDAVCVDEDFQADDFTGQEDYLSPLYEDYAEAIPLADYQADNAPYFTHTTLSQALDPDAFWNRRLDYLFTNAQLVAGSGRVYQDTMALSDHAPLFTIVSLPMPSMQSQESQR